MESPYYEMTHDFEEEHRSFQSGYIKGYNDAMMKFPSMLVRCKDCKHRTKRVCNNLEFYECEHLRYKQTKCGVTDNWFCADGERKKGAEESEE